MNLRHSMSPPVPVSRRSEARARGRSTACSKGFLSLREVGTTGKHSSSGKLKGKYQHILKIILFSPLLRFIITVFGIGQLIQNLHWKETCPCTCYIYTITMISHPKKQKGKNNKKLLPPMDHSGLLDVIIVIASK